MVGVVLAAGAGTRLRPLTPRVPKALCPVGGRPLVDLALERAGSVAGPLAVNVHHGRDALLAHLAGHHPEVHVSLEEPVALGTAGALGALAGWIDGRACAVVNADGWATADLAPLLAGWSGETVRLLTPGGAAFGPRVEVVASLLPAGVVERLAAVPSGLYERVWAPAASAGRLEVVAHDGPFVDCGTPRSYLAANLAALAVGTARPPRGVRLAPGAVVERSVVGDGSVVEGRVRDSVLWPGSRVGPDEQLVGAIRVSGGLTVWPGAGWRRG